MSAKVWVWATKQRIRDGEEKEIPDQSWEPRGAIVEKISFPETHDFQGLRILL